MNDSHPGWVVISGNPRPGSRTLGVATALAERIGPAPRVIELASLGALLFTPEHPDVRTACDHLLAAPGAVVATPSYKGTFTGLLKLFIDLLPADGLGGVPVVPVVVSGSPAHARATGGALSTLLGVVGGEVLPELVVVEQQLPSLPTILDEWVHRARAASSLLGHSR